MGPKLLLSCACTGMLHDLLARDTWGLMCLHLQGVVITFTLRCCSGLAPCNSSLKALFELRAAVGFILHSDTLGLDTLG